MATNQVSHSDAPTRGRRDRRKLEMRERIVQAAVELFSSRGFSRTTVEDITEMADVGKGTFFNYFPSKEHVLGALAEIQISKLNEGLAAARTGKKTYDVLLDLSLVMPRLPGRSRLLTRSLMSGLAGSETVRTLILPGVMRGREVLGEVFRLGQKRGEIRNDVDAADMAVMFQQSMFGAIVLWSVGSDGDLPKIIEKTFPVIWEGVRGPNAE
jgi:TetR/AcrR family transcriptional regulator, cholesterol catabolism regulator